MSRPRRPPARKLGSPSDGTSPTAEGSAVLAEISASLVRLEASIAALAGQLEGLPERLADSMAASAGQLGESFGRVARMATSELHDRLHDHHERNLDRLRGHEAQLRDQVATLTREVLVGVRDCFSRGLRLELDEALRRLDETIEAFGAGIASRGDLPSNRREEP